MSSFIHILLFLINIVNTLSVSYDFVSNIFFSLAYFFVYNTYKIYVNRLLSIKLLDNSRLVLFYTQIFKGTGGVEGGSALLTAALSKDQMYSTQFLTPCYP